MLVLCYGIPKSGSTLAFELVRTALKNAGFGQKTFVNDARDLEGADAGLPGLRNFINDVDRAKVEGLIAKIGPKNKVAVKTHSPFPDEDFDWLEKAQTSGDLQVFASYRDPREICLSLMDAARKARKRGFDAFNGIEELHKAQRNVEKRIDEFRKWAALKGTVRLGYDITAFESDRALDLIEKTLQIECDRVEVKDYVFYEAPTQRNKATKGRHTELSADDNADMLDKFGAFIRRVCEDDDQGWFDERRAELLGVDRA
ncbi:MAG TPA: hypothetical protein VHE09_17025 [Rhizomicrobium sp.]|nr:hypothetical protein [Rhizomicrobium sp.]